MSSKDVFYPKDENEKLAKEIPNMINANTSAISDLVNETSLYLKSWEMAEVLQKFAKEGLFMNVRGRNNIRKQIPHALDCEKVKDMKMQKEKDAILLI
jgi:hypothetical protein